MAVGKREIGDLLVDNGLITTEEYQQALAEREKSGEPMSSILSRMGLANESAFKNALELEYGVTYISLAKREPDLDLIKLLPEEMVREKLIVPVAQQGHQVTLAMVDPNDSTAVEAIKQKLSGSQVKTGVCIEEDFLRFIEQAYRPNAPEPAAGANGDERSETSAAAASQSEPAHTQIGSSTEPSDAEARSEAGSKSGSEVSLVPEAKSAAESESAAPESESESAESRAESTAESTGESTGEATAEAATEPQAESEPDSAAAESKSEPVAAVTAESTAESEFSAASQPQTETVSESADEAKPESAEESPAPPPPEPAPVAAPAEAEQSEAKAESTGAEQSEKPAASAVAEKSASTPEPAASSAASQKMNADDELGDISLIKRAQEEAIVLLANQILGAAIKRHCSNIHIQVEDKQAIVHYRLNGALFVDRKLPTKIVEALIARYKMMARLNLAERTLPQDGHIKVKSSAKEIVCLVSTVPAQYGENLVIWMV